MAVVDYYAVLDLKSTAKYEEIKASYRSLILKYHPDKILQNQSQSVDNLIIENMNSDFQAIKAAWNVLSDETKKREYDERLRQVQSIANVAEEVKLNELEHDSTSSIWFKDCRCGDRFEVRRYTVAYWLILKF
jgi:diphthamide biosynthesis protein 4